MECEFNVGVGLKSYFASYMYRKGDHVGVKVEPVDFNIGGLDNLRNIELYIATTNGYDTVLLNGLHEA